MTAAAAQAAPPTPDLLPLYGGGFAAIPAAEVDRLATVARAPGVVAVWAVLRMEASRRGQHGADLPRQWVAERISADAPTVDVVKKIPGRVATLTNAAVCIAMVDNPQRVRVEFPRHSSSGPGGWASRLRSHDLARILDPSDPMGWADLVPWLRWQQVLRLDEVWVTQAELARRWRTDPRTVRREQARLCDLGLLAVERQPGGLCRYWAAEITHRAQTRVLGPRTARWIRTEANHTAGRGAGRPAAAESSTGTSAVVSAALGGPDKVGTRSGHSRHRPPQAPPLSPRARVHACASHPVGTSVPTPQSPHGRDPAASEHSLSQPARRDVDGGDASPHRQDQASPRPRDLAWRQAHRIVQGQQWLMTTSDRVRWSLVATIARFLWRSLPGVTPASLTQALAQIDPDDHTTSHVALVRQAVSGLVADAKAAPSPAHTVVPQRPAPATTVHNDGANEAPGEPAGPRGFALHIDPAWADDPVPTEPRWHRTDTDDPDAVRWLAVLFLRRPSLRPIAVQQRLPQVWHPTVERIHGQVQLHHAAALRFAQDR